MDSFFLIRASKHFAWGGGGGGIRICVGHIACNLEYFVGLIFTFQIVIYFCQVVLSFSIYVVMALSIVMLDIFQAYYFIRIYMEPYNEGGY